jgi:hypothetical protein
MASTDLIDWPADRTLTLSGEAGSLRVPLHIQNGSDALLEIASLSLANVRLEGAGAPLRADPVPLYLAVGANQSARTRIRLKLDRSTPPGLYRGDIQIAHMARPVEIEVVERIELAVQPSPVIIDAALGRYQTVAVRFENRGNVALTLDLMGQYPLGEEIPLTPDRLDRPGQGGGRIADLLNSALGLSAKPALVEVGKIDLSLSAGPTSLAPGQTLILDVIVGLPGRLSPVARHHVFAPVYGADLHIVIVTAAKPHPPATPAKSKSGATP